MTSRGMMNEHYYAVQKAARAMGTNHVDDAARLCHAASTVAMKRTLGYGASTCSYRDWIGTDLIVFFGSYTPNNQPVTMKYLYCARKAGTKVVVVNPYFEPGLQRYWVPSVAESALFGTKIADEWFAVDTGGDLAFLNGVFKVLVAEGWVDHDFILEHTVGFEVAKAQVKKQDWDLLEGESGTTRQEMRRFAEMLRDAKNGIFVWSMGLTQHAHGVETIEALINVSLARGWVGRERTGLMPIRGHSGVQGGAEVGCVPWLEESQRKRFEDAWNFKLPTFQGLSAAEMVAGAYRGEIDVFWMVGGNFLETLPDPPAASQALKNVSTRIHQDLLLSSMMLLGPKDTVMLLPATTRYESPGGGTETSTERRIIFSPEIPGRRISSAKPEWEVFAEVAAHVVPELADKIRFISSQEIRDETFDGEHVTFRWKDYAHGSKQRQMKLRTCEFLRRFFLHVLPKAFVRIRHFGFLANRYRVSRVALCCQLLRPLSCGPATETSTATCENSHWHCPSCGALMVILKRFTSAELSSCISFNSS